MADSAFSLTVAVHQTYPDPWPTWGISVVITRSSMKAVTWLPARGLGFKHRFRPTFITPTGPFDPTMCAAVLHSVRRETK